MRNETIERVLAEAELRSHIERGLALADLLENWDAGIWLDRARVSLSSPTLEYQTNFAA